MTLEEKISTVDAVGLHEEALNRRAAESGAGSARVSRRALLAGMAALGPAIALSSRAFAEELQGDELPLQTTGLEHIGMVVPDVVPAARFYSSLFNPDMQ